MESDLVLIFWTGINELFVEAAALVFFFLIHKARNPFFNCTLTNFVVFYRTSFVKVVLVFHALVLWFGQFAFESSNCGWDRWQGGKSQFSPKSLHTPGQLQ